MDLVNSIDFKRSDGEIFIELDRIMTHGPIITYKDHRMINIFKCELIEIPDKYSIVFWYDTDFSTYWRFSSQKEAKYVYDHIMHIYSYPITTFP